MTKDFPYQKIAEKILELIDSGVFPIGSRLPGEKQLANTIGVSRAAIREARIALEAQGHIELKGRSGAYVLDSSSIERRGVPRVTPLELTEARALFEAESAALAAPIIDQSTISELEEYILIMSGSKDHEMTPDEADEAFHNAIARATGNKMIIFVIESMWKIRTENEELQKVYRKVCDKDTTHREQEHLAILQALKDRDPIAVRKAMRAHFTTILEELLEVSEKEAYEVVQREASENRSRFLLAHQIAV